MKKLKDNTMHDRGDSLDVDRLRLDHSRDEPEAKRVLVEFFETCILKFTTENRFGI